MRKFTLFACALAVTVSAMASTVDHQGQGMSGADAYSQVTFNYLGTEGPKEDLTAKAQYTLTATDDSKLNIRVTFDNLEDSKFIGLVPACYCIIDGIGETSLDVTDGVYTGTTTATFTEGTTYTGMFKRMSSAAWYGGDLLFPFSFTYTKDGGGSVTPDPVVTGNLWDNAVLEDIYNTYNQGTFDFANKQEVKFVLPTGTSDENDACFYLSTGIALTKGKTYTFEFDVLSNRAYSPYVNLVYDPGDTKLYNFPLNLAANTSSHFASEPIECPADITDLLVAFVLGGNPAGTEMTFSNFVLKEFVPEPVKEPKELWTSANVTVEAPYFAPDWNASTEFTESYENGALTLNLTPATTDRWQAQFGLLTNIRMTADNVYQFSCDITADKSFTALVKGMQNGNDGNFFCSSDVNLVAGETYHFTVNHITGYNIDPLKLLFDFGGNPASTKITVSNFSLIENPDESEIPGADPATESFIFIAPGTPESGEIVPVNFYSWWQANLGTESVDYENLTDATANTVTASGDDAASAGWFAPSFNFASVFAADYDLVFSIKSTATAKVQVKLTATKEQAAPIEFTRDGQWQTVRMNLATDFPEVVANGGYEQKTEGYVFSLTLEDGTVTGDTYTVTNVCWVPKGKERPAYTTTVTPEPTVPAKLYFVTDKLADAVEMTKDGDLFTAEVELAENDGFYFATSTSAPEMLYGAESETAMTLDTPAKLVADANSVINFKANYSGEAIVKVNFTDFTVTVTKKAGIETVKAAETAPAVYFNLQGVRVDNPANGIFIRKSGDTVTKVLVK